MILPFADRREAGRALGAELAGRVENPIVLGLPRGGVPVAWEVARALGAPLDVFVVRKLGHPRQPELAMGAVASGGIRVLNDGVPKERLEEVTARELAALEERERLYRGERPPLEIGDRTPVLVDDGLATGASVRAALAALGRGVVAVPVAPHETVDALRGDGIEVVCLASPRPFVAVGAWYRDFAPTSDEEVQQLLRS
ncbi:MAG TPA: phosphoribosyltransferase family protein [Gaiellaceae bacterium]